MIHCKGLTKTYALGGNIVKALDGVDLDIQEGDFVAIMGPSGSGKSTLMNVLGLLDIPESGEYQWFGQPIKHLTDDQLSHLRSEYIGFVFQQFHLLPRLSAYDNVALPLLYRRAPLPPNSSTALDLLKKVGLDQRMHHKPSALSGGQQQRVAIARALMSHPKLILADEPTGNLDSASQADIMALLSDLNASGITVVLITHEDDVAKYAKRVIRLKDGKVISDSASNPPLTKPLFSGVVNRTHSFKRFTLLKVLFRQALSALTGNWVRSMLSMLGILIGVAAVIAMLALGEGAKQDIEKRLSSLGSNVVVLRSGSVNTMGVSNESITTRFTPDDGAYIVESIPLIKRAAPSVSGRIRVQYGSKNASTQVLGTTFDYATMRASEPSLGRFFSKQEDLRREKVALIGMTVVKALFLEEGQKRVNPIGETILINRILFQIIGILPEKGGTSFRDQDDVVVIPLLTAMDRVLGKDYVDSIDLEVVSADKILEAQDTVKELMAKRHRVPEYLQDGIQIRDLSEIRNTLSQTSNTMSVLLASIAAISLIVGGIGIMNMMLISVTERTREIGLRKALGATPSDILTQFLLEALVLSIGGGVMGISLGIGVALLMAFGAGWTAPISIKAIGIAFGFSMGIGVFFGLWPAKKAAKLLPIESLRHD